MRIAPKHIKQITSATKGNLIGAINDEFIINNIAIDSRSNSIDGSTLFIALKGNNTDGHNYLKSAYNKGCRCFLVETPLKLKEALCIVVPNTLTGLQELAKSHRDSLNIPII